MSFFFSDLEKTSPKTKKTPNQPNQLTPSKSALYGDVTDRFSLNVECGRMRTRWPIIDILCRDGWRLNSTMSPFCRCRSTRKPYSRWRSASRRTKRRSRRWPSSRTMNLIRRRG